MSSGSDQKRPHMIRSSKPILALAMASLAAMGGPAGAYTLNISVRNNAPEGGFNLTPVFTTVHDGTFDAFTEGQPASPGMERLAELGAVSELSRERLAADPDSAVGVAAKAGIGLLPIGPGEFGNTTLLVKDPTEQRFFTYLSMLVPTNDTFLGNDDPLAYEIFSSDGSFKGGLKRMILQIQVTGADLRDAGTEVNNGAPRPVAGSGAGAAAATAPTRSAKTRRDPADGPAFVQGVDATLGTPEGGVVGPATSQAGFAGVVAANGIALDAEAIDFAGDPASFQVATITISPVPLPGAAPLLAGGLGLLAAWRIRRRRS